MTARIDELLRRARHELEESLRRAAADLQQLAAEVPQEIRKTVSAVDGCELAERKAIHAPSHAQRPVHEVGPPIVIGHDALERIAKLHGEDVVFHGTRYPIPELEPRQAYWKRPDGIPVPDGEPAICASRQTDVSTFRALVKGRIQGCDYFTDHTGQTVYRVPADRFDALQGPDRRGFVHVLPSRDFDDVELPVPTGCNGPEPGGARARELRAHTPQEPLCIVEVSADEFPYPVVPNDRPGDFDNLSNH
ncbi:hypothetical protein NN3_41770 [Nocardia neocaledoniensis NBRC 108232]|uniref:Uncharacterized protein n=1 Tax=Nocardia neocaledoniensis TaxID=236511 RepID=A0A317NLK7_9NOCA|nr:hypothetical protein [Nocardia neocaledoniensis]PWV74528.1 hypothetical protein DFR69_106339 [Nocardia neocaledoniensis]GEM33170.1 hypothetical protein NN3_41770 [Nocardia neocaledoniensis NBRC 108232]